LYDKTLGVRNQSVINNRTVFKNPDFLEDDYYTTGAGKQLALLAQAMKEGKNTSQGKF